MNPRIAVSGAAGTGKTTLDLAASYLYYGFGFDPCRTARHVHRAHEAMRAFSLLVACAVLVPGG